MIFEWDEDKANRNLKKHGIPFETAAKVFYDENRIEIYDKEHSIDEDRYITIGLAGNVLFVAIKEQNQKMPKVALAKRRPA